MRNGKDFGFVNSMTPTQLEQIKSLHNNNLNEALNYAASGECDLLILDELTYVYDMQLIDIEKINQLIKNKPKNLELVITEMKAVRHPFDKGINARKGIEY